MPETVRVKTPDNYSRDFIRIKRERFDPEKHEPFGNEDAKKLGTNTLEKGGSIAYEYAKNGFWTIYEDGEEAESGRTKSALTEALSQRGIEPDGIGITDGRTQLGT